ncbi:MAG: hypothetical protein IKL42_00960, partial [Clostridia bacterium]|nr:hypothetical protein [Clostridia bacterium]
AFKRMEGFVGSTPQRFIDTKVRKCPFCKTDSPHWALDMKMQMKMEGNLYLFKCEKCNGILSSPVADVTGENNSILSTPGLFKKLSGKKNGIIYIRIEEVGNSGFSLETIGKEYSLEEINGLAEELL